MTLSTHHHWVSNTPWFATPIYFNDLLTKHTPQQLDPSRIYHRHSWVTFASFLTFALWRLNP